MGAFTMSVAAEAERAFAICDQNSDSKISQEEMAFFLRALGQNPTNAEVKALPDNVDFATAFQYYEDNKKEPESAHTLKNCSVCGTRTIAVRFLSTSRAVLKN